MTDVQERLGQVMTEALERAPGSGSRQVDPAVAWAAGRARRRRRRVGGALAIAAAAAVVAVGGVVVIETGPPRSVAPADGQHSAGVASYPERVEGPRPWTGEVTDAGEPLAGVLQDDAFDNYGVTASGKLWRIPIDPESFGSDYVPVLSEDGTRLAWLSGPTTFQVLDVVTGEVVVYDGIGDNRTVTTQPYMTQGQVPGFFSPDGSRLAVNGWPSDDEAPFGSGWLLLDDDGGFVALPRPEVPTREVGAGKTKVVAPIGWADGEHLYWRAVGTAVGGQPILVLVTASLDGQVTRFVTVRTFPHPRSDSQWTASVSPGGQRVYLRSGGDDLVVDPGTGEVLETLSADPPSLCSPSWRGQQVLETDPGDGGAAALQALRERRDGGTAGTPVAVLEPGFGSCLVLTPQALAGGPTTTLTSWLFGTSTSWLSWHLAEVAAGLSGLAVLGAALVWWRRRRFRYDEV